MSEEDIKTMTINDISEKLNDAGYDTTVRGDKCYVNKSPCGKRDRYGYITADDDGSTGTCRNVTKRRGEIAITLREIFA